MQGTRLYTKDGAFFLLVQPTGEIGMFNTNLYNTYGASPIATAWRSQTFSLNAPFSLVMQDVRTSACAFTASAGSAGPCATCTIVSTRTLTWLPLHKPLHACCFRVWLRSKMCFEQTQGLPVWTQT